MKKIIILLPYFGIWPEWINLFIESCKHNPTIDWLFLTDCAEPKNRSPNVRYVKMRWQKCRRLISERLRITFNAKDPLKLCDLRPAFGLIFWEYLSGYDFFGFSDLDIIYGNIRNLLAPAVFDNDLITSHNTRVNGHFCLMKNTSAVREAFFSIANWKETFEDHRSLGFDESDSFYGLKQIYAKESYNTPLSPYAPWLDGLFKFPSEWYWREGRLWNNLDADKEFLYLHFMRLKSHWRKRKVVHFDYRNAPYGWKINLDGFFALEKAEEAKTTPACIIVDPNQDASKAKLSGAAGLYHKLWQTNLFRDLRAVAVNYKNAMMRLFRRS